MPSRREEKKYCLNCNKELLLKRYENCNGKYNEKFCSRKCLSQFWRGENHPAFKGGRFIDNFGYVHILVEGAGKYILEHRFLMENKIGRRLTNQEHVHHIDGDKSNNSLNNLMLLTINEHARIHGDERKGKPRVCIQKYEILKELPAPNKIGMIVSILPEYRTYITSKCLICDFLFWHRKDRKTKYCSATCGLKNSWDVGKYSGRKPKKCPKAH